MACVYKIDGKIFRSETDIQKYINQKYSSSGKLKLGKIKNAFITLAQLNGKSSIRTARHESLHYILEYLVDPKYKKMIMDEAKALMELQGIEDINYKSTHEFLADAFMDNSFSDIGITTDAVLSWTKDAETFLQENPSVINGFFQKINSGFYNDSPIQEILGNRKESDMEMENNLNDEPALALLQEKFGERSIPKVFDIARKKVLTSFQEEMGYASKSFAVPGVDEFLFYEDLPMADALRTFLERKRANYINLLELLDNDSMYDVYDDAGKLIKTVKVSLNDIAKGDSKSFVAALENSKKVPYSKTNEKFMKLFVQTVLYNSLEPNAFRDTKDMTKKEAYTKYMDESTKVFSTLLQSIMPGINIELKIDENTTNLLDAKVVVRDKDGETKSRTSSENFSSYQVTINNIIPVINRNENSGSIRRSSDGSIEYHTHDEIHGLLKKNAAELKRKSGNFRISQLLDYIKNKYAGYSTYEAGIAISLVSFFGNSYNITSTDNLVRSIINQDMKGIANARVGMFDFYDNYINNREIIKERQKSTNDPFYDEALKVFDAKYKEFRSYLGMLESIYSSDSPRVFTSHEVGESKNGELVLRKTKKNKIEGKALADEFKAIAYDNYNSNGVMPLDLNNYMKANSKILNYHFVNGLKTGKLDASLISSFLYHSIGLHFAPEALEKKFEDDFNSNDKKFLKQMYALFNFMDAFYHGQSIKGNAAVSRNDIPKAWDKMIESFKEANIKYVTANNLRNYYNLSPFVGLFSELKNIYKESNKENTSTTRTVDGNYQYTNPISSWFADTIFTGTDAQKATDKIKNHMMNELEFADNIPLKSGNNVYSSIYNGNIVFESLEIYQGVKNDDRGYGIRDLSQSDKYYIIMNELLDNLSNDKYAGMYALGDTIADKKFLPFYDYTLGKRFLKGREGSLYVDHNALVPALRDRMHYQAQEQLLIDEIWKPLKKAEYRMDDPEVKDFIYYNTKNKHYSIFQKDGIKYIKKPVIDTVIYGLNHKAIDKMSDSKIIETAKKAHKAAYIEMVRNMKDAGFFNNGLGTMSKARMFDFKAYQLDNTTELTKKNKVSITTKNDEIKAHKTKIKELTDSIQAIGDLETLSDEQITSRDKVKEEINTLYDKIDTLQSEVDKLSSESKKSYKSTESELIKMLLDNNMMNDDGKKIEFHPILEAMYWSHYLINAEISSIARGQVSESKNIVEWIKRAAGMIAPGSIKVPQTFKRIFNSRFKVLPMAEFTESNSLYNGEIDPVDGQITMNPVIQSIFKKILGGEASPVTSGSSKDVFFHHSMANNDLVYLKGNWFPITSSQVENSEFYRTALETMLGEYYDDYKAYRNDGMKYQDAIDAVAEDIIMSPKDGLTDKMVAMIAPESAIKQGIRKLNSYESEGSPTLQSISINPLLNNDDNTFYINTDGLRIQQATIQDIFDAKTSLPSQILNIVGGKLIKDGQMYFANRMSSMIQNMSKQEFIKKILAKELMKHPEYSKALNVLADPNISNDVAASKLATIIGSYISKEMRGSMPGSFNIQGAYIGESVEGEKTTLKTIGYEFLDPQSKSWVDIKTQDELKKRFENKEKIRFRKGEVVMGFNYANKFGIEKGITLRDSMKLIVGQNEISMFDREGKMSWKDMKVKLATLIPNSDKLTKDSIKNLGLTERVQEIINDLYTQQSERKISNAEAYEEEIQNNIDSLTKYNLGVIAREYGVEINEITDAQKKKYASFLFANRNKKPNRRESFGAYKLRKDNKTAKTNEEVESDNILAALTEYFYNYNKALDVFYVRLPTNGAAMAGTARIVGFEWDAQNTIYMNTQKNILDGSDQDGDQLNVFYRSFNDKGELVKYSNNAPSWNIQRKYDEFFKNNMYEVSQNRIFEGLEHFYNDSINYEQVLKKIDLQSFRDAAPKSETIDYSYNLGTAVKTQHNNNQGVKMVGHGANASSAITALRDAFENQDARIKRINKAEKEKQAKNPEYTPKLVDNIVDTEIFNRDEFGRLKFIPEILDFLTKFTNAATDNANEDGLLGKLNINEFTSPIITGILLDGKVSDIVREISNMPIGMESISFDNVDAFLPSVKKADQVVDNTSIQYLIIKKISGGKLLTGSQLKSALKNELSNYNKKILGKDYALLLPENLREKFAEKNFMKDKALAKMDNESMKLMNEFSVLEEQIGTNEAIKIYKANNNHSLRLNKEGKKSSLYAAIDKALGEETEPKQTLIEKAKYYTPTYTDAYGEWTTEPHMREAQADINLETQILNVVGSQRMRKHTKQLALKKKMTNKRAVKILGSFNEKEFGKAAKELNKYAAAGEQMRRLNEFLSLYNGIPTSISEADYLVNKLENYLGMDLSDFLNAKEGASIANQRKYVINELNEKYNNFEQQIRNSFDLFKVIKSRPNTLAHLNLLLNYKNMMINNTHYRKFIGNEKSVGTFYKKNVVDNKVSLSKEDYENLYKGIDALNTGMFLTSLGKITLGDSTYDFGNSNHRSQFAIDFVNYFYKVRSENPDNQFLNKVNIVPSNYRDMNGVDLLDFAKGNSLRGDMQKIYNDSFEQLNDDIKKNFAYYQGVVYGFEYRSGSMSNALGNYLEEKYTTWNEIRKTPTKDIVATELGYYAALKDIYLKSNNQAFDMIYDKSSSGFSNESLKEFQQELQQDLRDPGRVKSVKEIEADYYPQGVKPKGKWKVAKLTSIKSLTGETKNISNPIYYMNRKGKAEQVNIGHAKLFNVFGANNEPSLEYPFYNKLKRRNYKDLTNGKEIIVGEKKIIVRNTELTFTENDYPGIAIYDILSNQWMPIAGKFASLANGQNVAISVNRTKGKKFTYISSVQLNADIAMDRSKDSRLSGRKIPKAAKVMSVIINNLQKTVPNLKIEIVDNPMLPIGSVINGVVYLNQNKIQYDTPIHELGHVMISVVRQANPKLYAQFRQEALEIFNSDSKLSRDIQEIYSDKNKADQLEEIMAHVMGYSGAGILENYLNRSLIERVVDFIKKALKEFAKVFRSSTGANPNLIDEAITNNLKLGDFGKAMANSIISSNRISDISTSDLAILDTVERDSRDSKPPHTVKDIVLQAQSTDNASNMKNIAEMHRLKTRIRKNNMKVPKDWSENEEKFTELQSDGAIKRLNTILENRASRSVSNKESLIRLTKKIGIDDMDELSLITFGTYDKGEDEVNRFTAEKLTSLAKAIKIDGISKYMKYSDLINNEEYSKFFKKDFEGYDPIIKIQKTSSGQIIASLYDVTSTSISEFEEKDISGNFLNTYYDKKQLKKLGITLSNSEYSARQFALTMLRNKLHQLGVIVEDMGIIEIFNTEHRYRDVNQTELTTQIDNMYNNAEKFTNDIPASIKEVMAPAWNRIGRIDYVDLLMNNYSDVGFLKYIPTFYSKNPENTSELVKMLRNRQRDLQFAGDRYSNKSIDEQDYSTYNLQELRLLQSAIDQLVSLRNTTDDGPTDMGLLTQMFADSNTVGNKEADKAITMIKRSNKGAIRKYDNFMKGIRGKDGVFKWFEKKSGLKVKSYGVDVSEKMFERVMVTDTDVDGNKIKVGHIYWTVDEKLDPLYAAKAQKLVNEDPDFANYLKQSAKIVEAMDNVMFEITKHTIIKERLAKGNYSDNEQYINNKTKERLANSGYRSGMIPVTPTSLAGQISRASGVKKTLLKFWNTLGSVSDMYDDFDSSMFQEDNNVFEIADMFLDQFGIKSGQLTDNLPNGNISNRITKKLGLELVETGNNKYAYKLLNKERNNDINGDLETAISYFVLSMARKIQHEAITLPYINSLQTLLMDDMKNRNRETKPLLEYIKYYKMQALENKREKFNKGLTQMDRNIDKGTMTAMKLASFSVMAINANVGILSAISNGMKAQVEGISTSIANAWANSKEKYPIFDYASLLAAHGKMITEFPKMLQIANQYNVVAGSDFERVSSRYHTDTKHFALSRYWSNATNFYPDMLARMMVMTAQMIYDGNWEAHTLNSETGKVEYNPLKDKKYFKGNSLTEDGKLFAKNKVKQLKFDGTFKPLYKSGDIELPNQAYDDRDSEILRYVSDRFVVGSYSNETRSLYTIKFFGKIFGMFSQYATTVIQNAAGKKKESEQGGTYVIKESYNLTTGKVEKAVEFERVLVEGYFRTFFGIVKAAQEYVSYGKPMKPLSIHEKKNLSKLFVNGLTFLAVYGMYNKFVAKDWKEAEKDPNKIPPYRWVKNVKYSANSLLSLLIVSEFVDDPFVLGNIVTRLFQDQFGNFTLANYPFSGQLKQLNELLLMIQDDPVEYYLTQQKIEEQKKKEIQERRKK